MREPYRILNRDQLKLLAIITMTFNHFAHVFLIPGTALYEVFEDIGYFTAMTMCFFLVEGYRYTRSKQAYIRRLTLFALLSEVPYVLALEFHQLNVLYTLLLCFIILCVMDSRMAAWKKRLLVSGLVIFSGACDWGIVLPIGAILLKRVEGSRRGQALAYGVAASLFWLLNIPGFLFMDAGVGYAVLHGFYASLGVIASGVAVMVLYNGRKSEKPAAWSKWFFYIYYPAHLTLLWGLSLLVQRGG